MIPPPPFYHAGGILRPEGVKNFRKSIDNFRKPVIITDVAAKQLNMDAEMAELVEGARLEIV